MSRFAAGEVEPVYEWRFERRAPRAERDTLASRDCSKPRELAKAIVNTRIVRTPLSRGVSGNRDAGPVKCNALSALTTLGPPSPLLDLPDRRLLQARPTAPERR